MLDIRKMFDAYNECPEGKDAHTYSASVTFGVPYEDVEPEQRQFVKRATFGRRS